MLTRFLGKGARSVLWGCGSGLLLPGEQQQQRGGRFSRLALKGEEAGQGLGYQMHGELPWIWWGLGSLPLLEEWAFPVFTKSVQFFLKRNLKQSYYAQGFVFLQRAQEQKQWV